MEKLSLILLLTVTLKFWQLGLVEAIHIKTFKLLTPDIRYQEFQDTINRKIESQQNQQFDIPLQRLFQNAHSTNKYVKHWIKKALSDNDYYNS